IGVICRIGRLKRTLADQILLREEQIRQEDERARFIEDRSGARAMNALLAAVALRFGLKAYYKHKY
ncbi:MAG: hypothetical protein PUD68_01430, partial [Clostridiales bacterium]|nr:hypothetical protein [Clostridiales bacterium]